jgi:prolipoprotein diacylglyceryl transferase
MIAIGVLAAIWLLGRQLERKGIGTSEDASSIGIWGVAAGIIGARLYHVVTDWNRFSDNVEAIPKIWEGGLGIPGGLLAGVFVGIWQGKRRGIAPGELLTCAAPAIPLAQAIGRWGNWFNQELFGRQTDVPWALEIDDAHLPQGYESGTTFHATFLYESLWNFGLVGVLLWIDRRFRLGPGRLFAVYLIGYGIGRFWIEGLRIDAVQLADVAGLRWNQWVALAAIVGGGLYLIATRGQKWPERPDPADSVDDDDPDDLGPDSPDTSDVDESDVDDADTDPTGDDADGDDADDDADDDDDAAAEPADDGELVADAAADDPPD